MATTTSPYKDLLQSAVVLCNDDVKTPVAAFAHKQLALYFSANWCGPCKHFTPRLATYYKGTQDVMEIVFVSLDRSESEFDRYRKTMPWPALPFNPELSDALQAKLGVQSIPTLAVFSPSGELLLKDARAQVERRLAEGPVRRV